MAVGVNRGETVNVSNPRLVFYHRAADAGFLSAPDSLSFTIYSIVGGVASAAAELVSTTAIDLDDDALGVGRYAATWAVPADADLGPHEIRWSYVSASGGATTVYRERFEVLQDDVPADGWRTLVDGFRVLLEGLDGVDYSSEVTTEKLHRAMLRAAIRIEDFSRVSYEPTWSTKRIDVRTPDSGALDVDEPIIALSSVDLVSDSAGVTENVASVDIVVYNRHLRGMLRPDDRRDPRIESSFFLPAYLAETGDRAIHWPLGRQNARVTGLFGWRDPDPTSPVGRMSTRVEDAALRMISMELTQQTMDAGTLASLLGGPSARIRFGSV